MVQLTGTTTNENIWFQQNEAQPHFGSLVAFQVKPEMIKK